MRNPIRTEPDEWPPFHTLEDLALRHWNLRVRCRMATCQRDAVFGGAQLWYKFHRKHWSTSLRDVPGRLKCARCWRNARSRGLLEIEKTRDDPTVVLPDPDMGEWKRLVQRSRG